MRKRIQCGMGLFCLAFLARTFLVRNVFWDGMTADDNQKKGPFFACCGSCACVVSVAVLAQCANTSDSPRGPTSVRPHNYGVLPTSDRLRKPASEASATMDSVLVLSCQENHISQLLKVSLAHCVFWLGPAQIANAHLNQIIDSLINHDSLISAFGHVARQAVQLGLQLFRSCFSGLNMV